MAAIGDGGYYWSSTVSGTYASYLFFDYYRITPSNAYYRGYGWQVRCLRE